MPPKGLMPYLANATLAYNTATITASTSANIISTWPQNITIGQWWTQGTAAWTTPITVAPPATTAPSGAPNPAYPPPRVAAPRTFNRYVNASDLLTEFIAYLGTEGVRKREVMDLPLELFIKWLVIRACEVDQEDPGIVLVLPPLRPQLRCLGCGRWMRQAPVPLHDNRCAQRHFARVA